MLLIELARHAPQDFVRPLAASRVISIVVSPASSATGFAADRREALLNVGFPDPAVQLRMQEVLKRGGRAIFGSAHVLVIDVVAVDLACALHRWAFSDALGHRCFSLGTKRGEQVGAQADTAEEGRNPGDNAAEIFRDAAPIDVVGPGPEIERTRRAPPGDRVQLSIRPRLKDGCLRRIDWALWVGLCGVRSSGPKTAVDSWRIHRRPIAHIRAQAAVGR